MEVTETEGSENRTVSRISLNLDDNVPDKVAEKIKNDVGQYILQQVLKTLAQGESPVDGEKWPALSESYRKWKEKQGAGGEANMELFGDMLDALDFEITDEGIDVGFIDSDQAWKADGHLKFSGEENNCPRRRFLPGEGEEFVSDIQDGIERIIADGLSSQFSKSDFKDVETSSDLYEVLREQLGDDLTKNEIKLAVYRNDDLYNMLEDADLIDLL